MTISDIIGTIVTIIFVIFSVLIIVLISAKYIKNNVSSVKRIKATVIDKQSFIKENVSKSRGVTKQNCYAVTFLTEDKKHTFYVSYNTFTSCKLKQKGTLVYKGDKFLKFD